MAESFAWIGSSRRASLHAAVQERVIAWWCRWATLPCPLLEADPVESPAGHLQLGVHGDVAVQVRGSLTRLLLGLDGDGAGLPGRVRNDAVRDLLDCLGGSPDADPPIRTIDIPPARLVDERLGACRMAWLDTNGHGVVLCLARPAVDRIVPPPPRALAPAMTARHEWVGGHALVLRAEIELGSIGLGELRGLQPGDVLLTQAPLETLGRLVVRSTGQLLAETHLGQHQGMRAIQLAAPLSSESLA